MYLLTLDYNRVMQGKKELWRKRYKSHIARKLPETVDAVSGADVIRFPDGRRLDALHSFRLVKFALFFIVP